MEAIGGKYQRRKLIMKTNYYYSCCIDLKQTKNSSQEILLTHQLKVLKQHLMPEINHPQPATCINNNYLYMTCEKCIQRRQKSAARLKKDVFWCS